MRVKMFKTAIWVLILYGTAFGATKNVVPRANGEGSVGTSAKHWGWGYYDSLSGLLNYNTLYNKPSIPSAWDSAGVTGNSWKLQGQDTTALKSIYLAVGAKAVSARVADSLGTKPASQYQDTSASTTHWGKVGGTLKNMRIYLKDSTNVAVTVLGDTAKFSVTGKVASATAADSAGKAGSLQGKDTTAMFTAKTLQGKDTTTLFRTARSIKVMVDSSRAVTATRTPIFLTGILATDRAWVVFADSINGVRKQHSCSGVCKANSLVVFCDTTAATLNYLILR